MPDAITNAAAVEGIIAVIVDLDGTMLHTLPDFELALNLMCAELHLPPVTQAQIEVRVGKGSEHLVRSVLALSLPEAEVERQASHALARYLAHYADVNGQQSTVYPGVREGLDAMRGAGLRLACVTNKPTGLARQLLERHQLGAYFELLYGGDALPQRKPHPAPMLAVCAAFGCAPSQVLAIGDSSNDALAARAAGCRVLTVPYGYNHGESVQNIESDGIVSTLLVAAHHIL